MIVELGFERARVAPARSGRDVDDYAAILDVFSEGTRNLGFVGQYDAAIVQGREQPRVRHLPGLPPAFFRSPAAPG